MPLVALLLVGCDKPRTEAKPLRPVRTVTVTPIDISENLSQTGDIQARTETDFGFRIDGKIIDRSVDVGSNVRKGDVIARLDDQPARNRVQAAQASVASAEAELVRAQAQENRQGILLKDGYTTKQLYDVALRDLHTAQAQLDSARAQLDLAKDNLGYAELHADANGVVTEVFAAAGQIVAAGQRVVRIADPTTLEAVFGVAAASFSQVSDDAKIDIALTSDPRVHARGRLRYVSPQADPVTRTYSVRVALIDPPPEMMLGATVSGRVEGIGRNVIELPATAIYEQDGKPAVWVFDAGTGAVKLKPVTVTRYESDKILVSDGLAKGDVVVVAGVHVLRPGEKVRLLADAAK
jgi:RND family efflux transporter MFP subunit